MNTKKNAIPTKEMAVLKLKTKYSHRVPNRENTGHTKLTTGRFSDLRLTSRLLPIRHKYSTADSGQMSLGFPILQIGAGAHSGATVADFNRVPI